MRESALYIRRKKKNIEKRKRRPYKEKGLGLAVFRTRRTDTDSDRYKRNGCGRKSTHIKKAK